LPGPPRCRRTVLDAALAQIPDRYRHGHPILIRADGAGWTKAFLAHIRSLRDVGVNCEFSVDWTTSQPVLMREQYIVLRVSNLWTPAGPHAVDAKLADLGLIERRPSPANRRVNDAVVSSAGRDVTDAIDAARHRLNSTALAERTDRDLLELDRLLRRYVDDLLNARAAADPGEPTPQ
jgi:hypothetical protein